MRNARVFLPQSSVLSAETTFALAATFSVGETESSRSRNTRSALLAAAFSIIRSLLAGVDNSDRLRRIVIFLSVGTGFITSEWSIPPTWVQSGGGHDKSSPYSS